MIATGSIQLITNTPLVSLNRIYSGTGSLFAKAEFVQPGGSVKDRAALQIIRDAYDNGNLVKGQTVVEMTSGNMGAGLAVVCRYFGNPFVAVMAKGNSPERLKILRALGAEIVLTEQVDGTAGKVTGKDILVATERARQIAVERKGFYVDQFNNPSSVKAHFTSTGPEIWNDLKGDVHAFVASVGSCGTFTGTSKYLKEKNSSVQCIAVEPENAALLKTGAIRDPKHIVQGTGYGLVPPHWDKKLADEIITVTDEEVLETTNDLALLEGLFVGFSSGANVCAAIKYLKKRNDTINVTTILCDTGFKY